MKAESGRKLYSIKETYIIAYNVIISVQDFRRAKKEKLLSDQFIERIMLAVTEVNGCVICSYAHTKMALESGMENEEIESMLAGTIDGVSAGEMPAIMFAQHYADYRGKPTKEAWERIVDIYGLPRAKGILAAIRFIMFGNSLGIAWSSFVNRFRGKPDERSTLLYELGMVFSTIFLIIGASIHALVAKLIFRVPVITFKS